MIERYQRLYISQHFSYCYEGYVASVLVGRMAVNERVRIFENPFLACVSVHHGVLLHGQERKEKKKKSLLE
jgi:hypothetical protein